MSLEESLLAERANDIPTDELSSKVSKIRRHLFQGEALSAAAVVRDFGVSNGLLSITIRELRNLGYNFVEGQETATTGQPVTTFTMSNPSYWPSKPDFQRVTKERTARQRGQKQQQRARRRAPTKSIEHQIDAAIEAHPVPTKRRKLPLPVLPQLGSDLRVVMIRIDEESGAAYIGLKNGTVSWEVLVEAQS